MQPHHVEPKLKISGRKIITYGHDHDRRNPTKEHLQNSDFTRSSSNKSMFSKGSRKRLQSYLNQWFDTVRLTRSLLNKKSITPLSKHTFATLTLPSGQCHCDKTIKREAWNPFMIELQRDFGVKNFIWKAEPQKNGNIHFHLITSQYIGAIELRLVWLYHINKLGYVNRFKDQHNHFIPNASDIHSLKKINDVSSYVGKYMSKTYTPRIICGHTWGKSQSMERLKPIVFTQTKELQEWYWMVNDSTENHRFVNSHCSIISLKNHFNLKTLPTYQLNELEEILIHNSRSLALID